MSEDTYKRLKNSRNVYAKTKKCTVVYGPGATPLSRYTVEIPEGLQARLIVGGSTDGCYFLDEFPRDLFPACSFQLHDATHYGVVLSPEQVTPDDVCRTIPVDNSENGLLF